MVVLVMLAVVGAAALFALACYGISTKFPKAGDKINEIVEKVGSKFKKK